MVFAISSACSLLKAKSCTPLFVVSDSTMMSGCASGQPVAKAVTKLAEVVRLFIRFPVCCSGALYGSGFTPRISRLGHVSGDFDFDLGPDVDEPVDVEQRRRREVAPERFLPGRTDPGAGRLVFAAAGQIPGQADDVFRTRAGLAGQHDPFAGTVDLDAV